MERREFLKLTLGFTAAAGAIAATAAAAQAAPLLPTIDGTAPPLAPKPEAKAARPAGEHAPADSVDHELSSRHRHHHHHHHHRHWRRRWWHRHRHHHHW